MTSPSPVLSSRLTDSDSAAPDGVAVLAASLSELELAIAGCLSDATDAEARLRFDAARSEVASRLAQWPKRERSHVVLDEVRRSLSRLAASGLQDQPLAINDEAVRAELVWNRWPEMLGRMVLGPAWRDSSAPGLGQVPETWWAAYAEWLFSPPQGFTVCGDAERYAAHVVLHLRELANLVECNAGSSSVRAAVDAYLRVANAIQLYFAEGSLREHAELRGRILQRVMALRDAAYDLFPLAREGRRLRVGFVNRHFGSQTETYTTIPSFEALDPDRFEVMLFTCRANGSALENHCREKSSDFRVMPHDIAGQVACLREAGLDVVVFGTNVTAVTNEITRLALHRVAPLQVVNNSSCITSGLPEVDLYVSGELTETADAPSHFTERLGLLPGPTHAFNYEADRQDPVRAWTRADLGIPEDVVVFVSAANYYKVIPEMREAWARLLAQVPGSRLLLHPFNPNWSSDYPVKRFCAEFEAVLTRNGVDHSRLVVSTMKLPSRSDVGALMAVGDVYLDTAPFGGVNSLIDPLEVGVPVITWEGGSMRARMGAALLRSLGLPELITRTEDEYVGAATRLALEPQVRADFAARIKSAMALTPQFLDSLAASDVFGDLIETAYDEVVERGLPAFRRDRAPLRARRATPLTCEARRAFGNELVAQGRADRAVTYLMAALQQDEGTASLWLDVAKALRANGQHNEALQALETCLRQDETAVPAWTMLVELAELSGNVDLAAEARAMVARYSGAGSETVEGNLFAASVAQSPLVLLYTDDPEHGGVAQYNHSILKGLAAAGYRVVSAQSRSGGPLVTEQAALGVRHHWIDYDTGKDFGRTLTDQETLRAACAAGRPDLIVFSDCSPVSNLGAREAALQGGIPYITVVGFAAPYLAKNFAGHLPQLSRQHACALEVVAVSRENLDLLRQQFGTPADQGVVIHYGRPEVFFQPRAEATRARLRAELGLSPNAVVSLTTARLSNVKGHVHQIAALRTLLAAQPRLDFHLVWAGEGEERPALARAIAQAGLAQRVHFLGHRWDAADWYDAADLFTLSTYLEGMPLAIMEAMAKGLPVVASAVSGIPEEIDDTGLLLPDPARGAAPFEASLTAAWSRLALDAPARTQLGEAARSRANDLFREEKMVRKTLALIASHLPAVPTTVN